MGVYQSIDREAYCRDVFFAIGAFPRECTNLEEVVGAIDFPLSFRAESSPGSAGTLARRAGHCTKRVAPEVVDDGVTGYLLPFGDSLFDDRAGLEILSNDELRGAWSGPDPSGDENSTGYARPLYR